MSVADALAHHFSARTSRTEGSTRLIFEREGRWHDLGVRENPHVELSMAAPGLPLSLWIQVGDSTVLPDDPSPDDPRWRMRTNDELLAALLLDEMQWKKRPGDTADGLSMGHVLAAFIHPLLSVAMGARAYQEPTERYVLDVENQVATFQHYNHVANLSAARAMADHLLKLVMWPDRLRQRAAALAESLGGTLRGETMSNLAIAMDRQGVGIHIDLERTRERWRTRIRARSEREAVRYVEDLSLEPASLALQVERAIQAAGPDTSGSGAPYR
jgi:hypothetical protein